ncbi:AAA family ATPase [Actinoalloteichus hymeniacidonis]|uniref:MoxR-like ATPase n=1 Tax=Actinoalloteichus hymeniacidonis TaxID=340345 RepID=A0AAC9HLW2_9PSEU|nr:MoxR family ATPase [Actinoalloteichus hymeniacidonis]AOS61524.1 MoxR-like ATPase [Actinoalloteichus hymeniacidonis]MBB5910468.1 hypothetical protein [Actinoalloteichus hymeniacidonis]
MAEQRSTQQAIALAVAANLPVIIWGAPGTGKTSSVIALGRDLGLPVEVVVGSLREPSDFLGLPVLREGNTYFAPPRWAQRLAESGTGLLFLDELTTAPPAVQAAMLRIILERTVGDLELPPQVRIVAAANPPEHAADGWDLSAPLANRLIHLDWTVDAAVIAEGFTSGFRVPELVTAQPPTAAAIARARSLVGAFLRVRPELVLAVPDNPDTAGRSWPSPRSWELAARAIAASSQSGAAEEVRAELVLGAVGDSAGFELLSWLRNLDLPDPRELLADPAAPLPDRVDRLHALLGALVAHVNTEGDVAVWEGAWAVIARVARKAPDVAASAARALAAQRPAGAQLPKTMLELAPILRAAGLLT